MCKILCITNSSSCKYDFLSHIKTLAQSRLCGIVLREKHLSSEQYCKLAKEVISICRCYNMPVILHSFVDVALHLEHKAIHLPMSVLENESQRLRSFSTIGASVHSAEQAKRAESLGASYITYGHIFATDCKKGLQPRGADSIAQVVKSVQIPVYPLGGINQSNYRLVLKQGAEGFAVMSGLMTESYPEILNLASL